jgi:membrane protease YdiL (CAAX protease family)
MSFALFVLLGPLLASQGVWGLVAMQLVSFATPPLLLARARPEGLAALGLGRFPPMALAGTALIAISMWVWNVHWVAPIGIDWGPPDSSETLVELFALPSRPLWQSLLIFAIVPAVCEELLHRGVILPALSKHLGGPAALVLSSLLFGFSHFNLSRLLPTTVLGLAAGSVRLRSQSLWPCMVLHFLYNASLLIAAQKLWNPAASLAAPSALISLLGGAWLLHSTRKHADPDS